MKKLLDLVWLWIHPPHGVEPRRVVVGMSVVMGLSRLGFFSHAVHLHIASPWTYGSLFILLALGLALTTYRWRLAWPGRLIAVYGCVLWAVAGYDALDTSILSALVNWMMALILLGEASTLHEC